MHLRAAAKRCFMWRYRLRPRVHTQKALRQARSKQKMQLWAIEAQAGLPEQIDVVIAQALAPLESSVSDVGAPAARQMLE